MKYRIKTLPVVARSLKLVAPWRVEQRAEKLLVVTHPDLEGYYRVLKPNKNTLYLLYCDSWMPTVFKAWDALRDHMERLVQSPLEGMCHAAR